MCIRKTDRATLLKYLKERNNDVYSLATQLAFQLIIRIGELSALRWDGIDGEYIFMPNGRQMQTCTFNRHLKKFCENAGIEYHSSHKIRFTSASMLYKGHNLALLSQLLEHTTTTMTLHYFRNILGEDEVKELMKKLDDVA